MSNVEFRDHDLTLEIERVIDAPVGAIWRCWTEPDLLKQWYCPKPWYVSEAEIDLRPGGRFNAVMNGPDGERHDVLGIFLDIDPLTSLTFTDAYTEGYIPSASHFMTGYVRFADIGGSRTRMTWGARHTDEDAKQKHKDMGFEEGWKAAAAQLADLAARVDGTGVSKPPMDFAAKTRTCFFLADAAEQAADFYVSLLPDSRIDRIYRPDPSGPALVVEFTLGGTRYMTLNGNPEPHSSHQTSISVLTEDQAETDRLWNRLTADGGEDGRCGWLKDRFGIHWQIVPKALPRLMNNGDPARAGRVQAAMMSMNKIDIAGLEAAAAAT